MKPPRLPRPPVFGGVGQFAIGNFTADSASESVEFTVPAGGQTLLDGFQLREVAVATPLPSSASGGMVLLGGLGLMTVLRRRWSAA